MTASGIADPHRLVRARLAPYRAGLLGVEDARVLREHVRGCDACRAAFDEAVPPTYDEDSNFGHLPDHLLVRWERAQREMPPALAQALAAHLAACDECRASLNFLRLLEGKVAPRPRPTRRFTLLGWLATGAAALAAVFAVAVAVRPVGPREASPPPPPTGTAAPVPGPAPPTGAPDAAGRVVPLGETMRGEEGGDGAVLTLAAAERVLDLVVPPLLGVAPAAGVTIDAIDARGNVRATRRTTQSALLAPGGGRLRLEAAAGATLRGAWRIRVTSDVPNPLLPGSFEGAEYRLEIR